MPVVHEDIVRGGPWKEGENEQGEIEIVGKEV